MTGESALSDHHYYATATSNLRLRNVVASQVLLLLTCFARKEKVLMCTGQLVVRNVHWAMCVVKCVYVGNVPPTCNIDVKVKWKVYAIRLH